MRIVFIITLLLIAIPAAAQDETANPTAEDRPTEIFGSALALDGGTIQIGNQQIRLSGIDAPDMSVWPWGQRSRAALDDLISGQTVNCQQRDIDRLDRPIALCGTSTVPDLGEAMLRAGHATVFRAFTATTDLKLAYEAAEQSARQANAGVWSQFVIAHAQPQRSWFERYQNVLAALGAIVAAVVGAFAVLRSAKRQFNAAIESANINVDADEKRRKEDLKRRADSFLILISADILSLNERFEKEIQSLERYLEKYEMMDGYRYDYRIRMPSTFNAEWEYFATLPKQQLINIRDLRNQLEKFIDLINDVYESPDRYTSKYIHHEFSEIHVQTNACAVAVMGHFPMEAVQARRPSDDEQATPVA